MNTEIITKKSLVLSAITLLLSIALMIGTTYAWYTDSVSTGVNVIKSGSLDIEIQVKDENGSWTNANNQTTLNWYSDSDRNTPIGNTTWKSGNSYYLQEFRLINSGDLSLKYQISVGGLENTEIQLQYQIDNGEPQVISPDTNISLNSESNNVIKIIATMPSDVQAISGHVYNNIRIIVYAKQVAKQN